MPETSDLYAALFGGVDVEEPEDPATLPPVGSPLPTREEIGIKPVPNASQAAPLPVDAQPQPQTVPNQNPVTLPPETIALVQQALRQQQPITEDVPAPTENDEFENEEIDPEELGRPPQTEHKARFIWDWQYNYKGFRNKVLGAGSFILFVVTVATYGFYQLNWLGIVSGGQPSPDKEVMLNSVRAEEHLARTSFEKQLFGFDHSLPPTSAGLLQQVMNNKIAKHRDRIRARLTEKGDVCNEMGVRDYDLCADYIVMSEIVDRLRQAVKDGDDDKVAIALLDWAAVNQSRHEKAGINPEYNLTEAVAAFGAESQLRLKRLSLEGKGEYANLLNALQEYLGVGALVEDPAKTEAKDKSKAK